MAGDYGKAEEKNEKLSEFNYNAFLKGLYRDLKKLYNWRPQYWNFALVGAVGVVLQYIITAVLMGVGLPWFLAMGIGIFAAFNSNYFFNKTWVFNSKDDKHNSSKPKRGKEPSEISK